MVQNLIQVIEMKKEIVDRGITFINATTGDKYVPYNELYVKSRILLSKLQKIGVGEGEKVVFQISDNESFIVTFWACILGRIIPVPLPVGNSKESIQQIHRIFDKLDRPLIISDKDQYENLKVNESKRCLLDKCFIIDESEQGESGLCWGQSINSDIDNDEVAFIQFSSGSTGEPKGVEITHNNILALIKGMNDRMKVSIQESTINWMPLTHNTGLLGGHLFSNVYNLNCYLIKPQLFLMTPSIWLEKISEYRSAYTCCPNFGYKHCMRALRNKQLKDVDLSCLKMILNGAEPVSKEVCEHFIKTFSQYGINENVMVPTYGLSEATVVVTFTEVNSPIEAFKVDINEQVIGEKIRYIDGEKANGVEVVSLGKPITGVQIRIVNAQNVDIGEDRSGYLQVKGKTVSRGYYGIENSESKLLSEDGWLNTGDIGFIHDQKLFISGRSKDVIFVNGKNYYCSDIEQLLISEGVVGECAVVAAYDEEKSCDQILVFIKEQEDKVYSTQDITQIKQAVMDYTKLKIDHVIAISQIPRGSSGKVQRYKLQQAYKDGAFQELKGISKDNQQVNELKLSNKMSRETIINHIQEVINELIGFKITDLDKSLLEYGVDSIKVPQFKMLLEERLNQDFPVSMVFDHPTINQMADYILGEDKQEAKSKNEVQDIKLSNKKSSGIHNHDIAVIGLACRFPDGANDIQTFWEKLVKHEDLVTDIPWDRKEIREYYKSQTEERIQGGFLEDVSLFDTSFFNITPLEAKYMDPQQRILLEVTHEALQSAGINDAKGSNTGVFVGASSNDYSELCKESQKEEINNYMITGNMLNIAAGRIGYVFDLHGPIITIDTACSSSLVAVHEATKSLRLEECDTALAGGVNLILSPRGYRGLKRMNALSPTNRCKAFDDAADGYVRSEGCGMLVLKRYEDAVKDHNQIWGIIKGSALNHDGQSSGLTAPNGVAQENVIKRAMKEADIAAGEIDYIETHGTGTKLGDPQEINALANVFSDVQDKKVLLGSVKSNMGHMESAAGIASLIKVILAFKNKMIPADLHFNTPNKYINWSHIPFKVLDENYNWNSDKPLTVGVSSFGLSGTNVHMILQEHKQLEEPISEQEINILTLSVKKKEALEKEIQNYINYLEESKESLTAICNTSNKIKSNYMYRAAWVCREKEELIASMKKSLRNLQFNSKLAGKKVTFMFDDEESIYTGMGKELYKNNRIFRNIVEEIEPVYKEVVGQSLEDVLFNLRIEEGLSKQVYAAVVAFEYALVRLWEKYGIIPDQVFGCGVGEYVAACSAGIITLRDAIRLAYAKGKLMNDVSHELVKFLVFEEENVVSALIENNSLDDICISEVSSPKSIVVVGNKESMEHFKYILEENKCLYIKAENLQKASIKELESQKETFSKITEDIRYSLPSKEFISLQEGYTEAINTSGYWKNSICRLNDFSKTIRQQDGSNIFIEIGGSTRLSSVVTELMDDNVLIVPSIRKLNGECRQIAETVCSLYKYGEVIDWKAVNESHQMGIVQLPNNVYVKKKYWCDLLCK